MNLGGARATLVGDGTVAEVARSRNWAEDVTKFRPSIWVAHCSGVRVLCVCPNGVIASYLELVIVRNECGEEAMASVHAWKAASDVKSICWRHGDLF